MVSVPSSMVESVFLKSKRVLTSRCAWSTALRTSCMSISETTSKLGMHSSYPRQLQGRCPSGQREQTVNLPAQPTEVQILHGPPIVSRNLLGGPPPLTEWEGR